MVDYIYLVGIIFYVEFAFYLDFDCITFRRMRLKLLRKDVYGMLLITNVVLQMQDINLTNGFQISRALINLPLSMWAGNQN